MGAPPCQDHHPGKDERCVPEVELPGIRAVMTRLVITPGEQVGGVEVPGVGIDCPSRCKGIGMVENPRDPPLHVPFDASGSERLEVDIVQEGGLGESRPDASVEELPGEGKGPDPDDGYGDAP